MYFEKNKIKYALKMLITTINNFYYGYYYLQEAPKEQFNDFFFS